MSRAVADFSVSHNRMKLRVRVLPTVADVDAAYRGGRRRCDGKIVNAYFEPSMQRHGSVGTIVLPADGSLAELVPHEVVHAVMHRIGGVHCSADELLATAVGILSARIFRRCAQLGIGVKPS